MSTVTSLYPCPCCEHKTFHEKPNGTNDICPVCFWEDDLQQLQDPDYEGGANPVSLKQARRNFAAFGASDESVKTFVRPANADE